ncbi:MAG: hypothetical protein KC591_12250 [Gemmatimonadetes bacterium]|nr:hypothetical protein [Gemmatimonadota bacterium]
MKRFIAAGVAIVALLGTVGSPRANTIIISQDRSTSVYGEVFNANSGQTWTMQDAESAPDQGLFDSSLSVGPQGDGALAMAQAFQTSSLAADSLSAIGSTFLLLATQPDSSAVAVSGSATSTFDVVFELTGAAAFALAGHVSAGLASTTDLTLTGPGGLVYEAHPDQETVFFDEAGVLGPGQYQLQLHVVSEGTTQGVTLIFGAGYDLLLTLEPTVSLEPASWSSVKGAYHDGTGR